MQLLASVGSRRDGVQFLLDQDFQFTDPCEVGIFALFLAVQDLFTVQVDLQPSGTAGGKGYGCGGTVCPEELIRQPRGGGMVLSRDAVNDLQMDLAVTTCHENSPPVLAISRLDYVSQR